MRENFLNYTISDGIVARVDVERIDDLYRKLKACDTDVERVYMLDKMPRVQIFFQKYPFCQSFLGSLSPECEYVMKVLIALGQHHLFSFCKDDAAKLRSLINQLLSFEEEFPVGIVGYHRFVMHLQKRTSSNKEISFLPPKGFELTDSMVRDGLFAMDKVCEFYPMGGTADRLNNKDPETGEELPAAPLDFLGKPLLEGLLRDLRAREILFERVTGGAVEVPIVLMTSNEKGNHKAVKQLFEENAYFGRSRTRVKFIVQPSVPCLDENGYWCLADRGELLMKPGGHGAIWELARRSGIFKWLESMQIESIIARQINNPIGGTDSNLLSLLGHGTRAKKSFGFLSCERRVRASEGMLVLKNREGRVSLSNIEYCDFEKLGIQDVPKCEGSAYSLFPSNTNLLFVNLKALQWAVNKCPHPGPLLNFKNSECFGGERKVARLETTMQNIADVFETELDDLVNLQTFMLFSKREKTISVVKNEVSEENIFDTPKSAYYDLLALNAQLLARCGFVCHNVSMEAVDEMLPETIFLYHPALGPLYNLIEQKLCGGRLSYGSELILELADISISKLNLEGSMQVIGEEIENGSCVLEGVTVMNRGLKETKNSKLWSGEIERQETLTISLGKGSSFTAKNITFYGSMEIAIPDGASWVAKQNNDGEITFIADARPLFKYSVDKENQICLEIVEKEMATR